MDGGEIAAGAGAAWGDGPPPDTPAEAEREPVDLGPLVDQLRAAIGAEQVITHKHQLRTYESDGLL
jgi:hypothetical protein